MRYSTVEVWDHHSRGVRLRLRAEAVYDFFCALEDVSRVYVNGIDVTGDPDSIERAQMGSYAEPGVVVWHDNITRDDDGIWHVSARSTIEHDPWDTTPPMGGMKCTEVVYHPGGGDERHFTCTFAYESEEG